jgi:hypothetical protein
LGRMVSTEPAAAHLSAAVFREEQTWQRNATLGGKKQSFRRRRL